MPDITKPRRDQERPSFGARLKAVARTIAEDPGVREGSLMIVTALAALAVRAMSPERQSLARPEPEDGQQ